ncbi:MAG TPA: hypothetical protein VFS18_04515 [Actinomycetota bacterium]|nr:hypothetical protein [Actinomycetota bacterium]
MERTWFGNLRRRAGFLAFAGLAAFAGWTVGDAPTPSADAGPPVGAAVDERETRLNEVAEQLCGRVAGLDDAAARRVASRFVENEDLVLADEIEVVERAYSGCVPASAVNATAVTRDRILQELRYPTRRCPSRNEGKRGGCTPQGSVPKSLSPKSPNPGIM